ncbi:oocyte zinc finger protein XlCOF6-like [Cloeon dipterum]|uniref:oocyte zinc finger protein XlCOF6-like n=1 Tax=Cloeon dipterum TaxID=197152 RepID=UPI003220938A
MESRHSRSLRSQVGKTPIQKPLCRLCECPTSDGHVLASQVDRWKLRKWAMEVMNLTEEDENLPDVVGEDALICYFCIWQAEFGDESGDEAVAWWPKNLDLEENAKVLRENYSVGEVEQCWVQLEEVDLAKCTKESPKKRKFDIDLAKYEKKIPKKWKYGSGVCFYCGKMYNSLRHHVKLMHKEAIKCGIRGCRTYFHTEEEKEQHMIEDLHEKLNKTCEKKNICCKFCENFTTFSSNQMLRYHMKRYHPELPVTCTHYGCKESFKSRSEWILHINLSHKEGINHDLYLCEHCEFFTTHEFLLRKHEQAKHKPKIFKCDSCDAKFGSKVLVNKHFKRCHTFENCKSCGQVVTLGYKPFHTKPSVCSRCKVSFDCSGLNQLHKKSCKSVLLKCTECGKPFTLNKQLNRHVKIVHTKSTIFRCGHCDQILYEKHQIIKHMQRKHFPKTIKCDECDKLYSSESFLKYHKQRWHEYVRCAECGQEVRRQNMPIHRTVKNCRRCNCNFKCQGFLEKHKKSCEETALLSCKVCGKAFNVRWKLNCHVKQVHNKSAIFRCDHCEFSAFKKNLIERHIQYKHFP